MEAVSRSSKNLGNSSIHQDLARLSRSFHSQLDESSDMIRISRGEVTIEEYGQILFKLAQVHVPIEAEILKFLASQQIAFDFTPRKKAHLLLQDLSYLKPNFSPSQIPRRQVPHVTSIEELMGFLYVVEGSTLGGNYIAKALNRSLQIDAEHGAAFFNAYSGEVETRWAALWVFIEANSSPAQLPQMAAATITAFQLFQTVLCDSVES